MGVNETYYGDHFVIYTNIKSLCCTPETPVCQLHLHFWKATYELYSSVQGYPEHM